ncbi:ureidoglycolate lyase [Alcaligenes ammonioxydans]|uniref:ureidoglycolate lyase n=1 Tax=Alcaligenes ammonioxydans TaxID=2582914 RepID=UPI001F059F9F|nr:ureidoglycolate lyase [Alcaligenes ammonioxydans]MCH1879217.1 ureidoglycolate lyase [Alcaligenes ammonioxydans]
MPMTSPITLTPQSLSPEVFAPYGWMLGKDLTTAPATAAFSNAATDFWHEHAFDTGPSGQTEVLWVNYRIQDPSITTLENHLLTQQALIPLTGEVIHIVAQSTPEGGPDLKTLKAFRIIPGQGVCMRPGCWHSSRVAGKEVTCLMLTRLSTTVDLVAHLSQGQPARESELRPLEQSVRVIL